MDYAIEARDLRKTYPGDVRALDGLDFAVEPGTVFGLLGPNGAGKSTAVKILTTLARADAGAARVAGHRRRSRPDAVRRAIGVVAQKAGVDREATGRENLRLQGQVYGLRGRELEQRASTSCSSASASPRPPTASARGYSGGMERRLDIAMALIHRPSVLFLDEPTTGLDPEVRADMWREIERLARDAGHHRPADHPLPRGGRPAGRAAGDRRPRARWWPSGTPEELKGDLHGDAVVVELERADNGEVTRALERVDGLREISVEGTRAAGRARRRRTRRPVGAAGARGRAACRWPRSPSRARRSTTSTCATPAARSTRPRRRPRTSRRRRADERRARLRARLARSDRPPPARARGASPGGSS